MVFRKWRKRASNSEPDAALHAEDYAYLHTLCTVWPQGPMAQAFLKNPSLVILPHVAAEIRKAIEVSCYADWELGQDQMEFLRRLERIKPAPGHSECLEIEPGFRRPDS